MASLEEIISEHQAYIDQFVPQSAEELEAFRIRYLGTKGIVKEVFALMKSVPAEEKKAAGQKLNAFKKAAEQRYASFQGLATPKNQQKDDLDLSMPGLPLAQGSRHPLSTMER